MNVNGRIKYIRETQKRLLGITDDGWIALYIESENLENSGIGTILTWEKGRNPHIMYLQFLCRKFNYNPAFILGLTEKPEFLPTAPEKDFPEINHICKIVEKCPSIGIAFREMVDKKAPTYLKKAYLALFNEHPDIYDELKILVETHEKHPGLFSKVP